MKRNIESFMPLDGGNRATEELRERGRKAMEEYIKAKNGTIKC